MRLLRLTLPLLAALPLYASADMCNTVEKLGGGSAQQCHANTAKTGAKISDNWITYKPVNGTNLRNGKKGLFTITATPASGAIGFKISKFIFLNMDCMDQKRVMRLDYDDVVTVLSLKDKDFTFKVDNQPVFTETWELSLNDQSHHAPASSVLAAKLKGAKKVEVTWGYNKGKPPVGYVFEVSGFDQASASLCK
jgi:hypothetical protein